MDLHNLFVRMNADGVISRRSFLTSAGVGALGFAEAVKASAPLLRKQGMACILLFMNGGPSQSETFDPKPGTKTGGETKDTATAVAGIHIADTWPKVAKQMK